MFPLKENKTLFNFWINLNVQCKYFDDVLCRPLKFRYSEKAIKIWKNLPIYLTLLSKFKKIGRFFRIFVAFSEYLNFKIFAMCRLEGAGGVDQTDQPLCSLQLPTLAKIQTHLSESMIDNPPDLRQARELYRNKKEPHIQ